jgi:hypothetical protein
MIISFWGVLQTQMMLGFTYGNGSPGWQASALRLIDILMDGLTPSPGR